MPLLNILYTQVPDPYRWLEDENSKETKDFMTAQQKLTNDFMGKIPSRPVIRQRLLNSWNFATYSTPSKINGTYYSFDNTGLENQKYGIKLLKHIRFYRP